MGPCREDLGEGFLGVLLPEGMQGRGEEAVEWDAIRGGTLRRGEVQPESAVVLRGEVQAESALVRRGEVLAECAVVRRREVHATVRRGDALPMSGEVQVQHGGWLRPEHRRARVGTFRWREVLGVLGLVTGEMIFPHVVMSYIYRSIDSWARSFGHTACIPTRLSLCPFLLFLLLPVPSKGRKSIRA